MSFFAKIIYNDDMPVFVSEDESSNSTSVVVNQAITGLDALITENIAISTSGCVSQRESDDDDVNGCESKK